LIRGHGIKHITLVAHDGCGYYKERYRFDTPEQIVKQQKDDLRTAAEWVAGSHPDASIVMYFAKPEGNKIAFEELTR
jgi:hypothetical protein